MLALLAAISFRPIVNLPPDRQGASRTASRKHKRDSIAYRREQRRDSLRAARPDEIRSRQGDPARADVCRSTPAVLACAFKDPRRDDLLLESARGATDSGFHAHWLRRPTLTSGCPSAWASRESAATAC